jgi:hypothetical protein
MLLRIVGEMKVAVELIVTLMMKMGVQGASLIPKLS